MVVEWTARGEERVTGRKRESGGRGKQRGEGKEKGRQGDGRWGEGGRKVGEDSEVLQIRGIPVVYLGRASNSATVSKEILRTRDVPRCTDR